MRTHTGKTHFKCYICGAHFSQHGNLVTHSHSHRREIVRYVEHNFHVDTLKTHVYHYTGQRPYTCDICNAGFKQKGALNSHMRFHTGEKPYKCDICMAQFSWNEILKGTCVSILGKSA